MMLNCSNLKKTYFNKTAVENISLDLEKGKIYALLGPNGSGKTTFMKMVSGLVKPTQGSITYKNQTIGVESKKEVAYMSTEPYFYKYMTVEDIGKYYADFFSDFDREVYLTLLDEMELDSKTKVNKLSTGMVARVKLAATLARKAKLYLLDEPLNGIDLLTREKIVTSILKAADEDSTIVISSHLVEELESFVDGVIFIKDGRNVLVTDVEEMREMEGKSVVDMYKEIYA